MIITFYVDFSGLRNNLRKRMVKAEETENAGTGRGDSRKLAGIRGRDCNPSTPQ